MKEQIKELRVRIDGLNQLVKSLDYSHLQVDLTLKHQGESIKEFTKRCHLENLGEKIFKQSTERNECYKSLILAKAWLGKVLGELGETTPYANDGKRKTVEDIEPTADTEFKGIKDIAGNDIKAFKDMNHIEKVDWLRQEIEKLIKLILPMHPNGEWKKWFLYQQKAHEYLCEARFWLGFELQRIKEESDKSFQTHIIKEEGIKINK